MRRLSCTVCGFYIITFFVENYHFSYKIRGCKDIIDIYNSTIKLFYTNNYGKYFSKEFPLVFIDSDVRAEKFIYNKIKLMSIS